MLTETLDETLQQTQLGGRAARGGYESANGHYHNSFASDISREIPAGLPFKELTQAQFKQLKSTVGEKSSNSTTD